MAVSDRIGVMRDGELVQVGTPAAVYRNPASPFVASFIGDTTLVDGTVEPAAGGAPTLTVGDWVTVPVATDATGTVTASIRPEMVARTDDAAADHAFEAVVRERTFQGRRSGTGSHPSVPPRA